MTYAYNSPIHVTKVGKLYRPRVGTARWRRYFALINCRTVGEFLAQFPAWNATITRHVEAGRIQVLG